MWPVTITVTKCNEIYVAKMHCEFAQKHVRHTTVIELGTFATALKTLCGDFSSLITHYEQATQKECSAYALKVDNTLVLSDDCSTDTIVFSEQQQAAIKAAVKQAINFTCV